MPAYDSEKFAPPAPLARVELRCPETGGALPNVPMLLDWGADVTLIPQAAATRIGASVLAGIGYELVGFDGTPSVAPAVQVDLRFLRRTFKGRFLLLNQEWGIVGRDILNHLVLLLDGPGLTWSEFLGAQK